MRLTQNGKFLAKGVGFINAAINDGVLELRPARPISARNVKLLLKNNKRRFVLTMDYGMVAGFDGICVRVRRNLLEVAIISKIATMWPKRKARRKANLKPNK